MPMTGDIPFAERMSMCRQEEEDEWWEDHPQRWAELVPCPTGYKLYIDEEDYEEEPSWSRVVSKRIRTCRKDGRQYKETVIRTLYMTAAQKEEWERTGKVRFSHHLHRSQSFYF